MNKIIAFITIILVIFPNLSLASQNSSYPALNNIDYIFLMDQDTKEVLLEKNADEKIAPSSMTKLMTAYVVFDQIQKGIIDLNNQCVIGKDAWRKRGSTMFLNHGDIVSINDLLTGLLVVSGNDAAVALAQAVSGSVKGFAELMNKTAKRIGLKNSNFRNPHGLNQKNHYMSLRDLGILSRKIATDFPEHLHYFTESKFTYQDITQRNRNPLIKKNYEGVTGMKTGRTTKGGFGVVGSAVRGDRKLIAIINKAKTSKQREKVIKELLDYGFNNYKKITFIKKDHSIAKAKVWLGKTNKIDLISNKNISINIPKSKSLDDIDIEIKYIGPIYAPIKQDEEIAKLIIKLDDKKIKEAPLFAKENIDKAGYLSRIYQITKYKLYQLINITS